jgi:hypothetical protein
MRESADLVKDGLRDYPQMPHRALARMLYKKDAGAWGSLDACYNQIRYWGGCRGDKLRSQIPPENIRPPEIGEGFQNNPLGLPPEFNDKWEPMAFPVKAGKGLVLCDPHMPYHDINAITLAIRHGQEKGCKDFVLLLGDIHDNKDLSKFDKDPGVRDYAKELDSVKTLLDVLQREFPNAQLIYKKGNHELRTDYFLRRKAPELWGMKNFIWENYLGLKERGVISVPADVPMTVGKLNIIHGHELRGASTAVNAARGAYLKANECVLVAHWHRSSMHTETSFSRRFDVAWSVGCLCNLTPDWCRINKWNQGFATLEIDGKDFHIENERIIDGNIR